MKRIIGWTAALLILAATIGSILVRLLRWDEPPAPVPRHLRLEVANGCGRANVGDAVMRELQHRGFNVYVTRNSDRHYQRTTVIDLRDPSGANAHAVARALGVKPKIIWFRVGRLAIPDVTVQLDSSRYLEARVVVGEDFQRFFPSAVPLY